MVRILFLCHGNICRSPMAEFIMKYLIATAGLNEIVIESAAVSREEIGNDIYPPAKRTLAGHGIPFERRAARQIDGEDIVRFDRIVAMDRSNIRILQQMFGKENTSKAALLMSIAGEERDVEDPWYTGDYESAFQDILQGCRALLIELTDSKEGKTRVEE